MWMVLSIIKSMTAKTPYGDKEASFNEAGLIGMCPVFETENQALEFSDGKASIIKVERTNPCTKP